MLPPCVEVRHVAGMVHSLFGRDGRNGRNIGHHFSFCQKSEIMCGGCFHCRKLIVRKLMIGSATFRPFRS